MSGIVRDVSQSFAKYLKNLKPSEDDERKLTDVRREIRSRVRVMVSHFGDYLSHVANSTVNFAQQAFAGDPKVKFVTQGSFAYGTLNRPAHIPPQQMDLDDGAYFPIAAPVGNLDSRLLIGTMDQILSTLSREKGWSYREKPTCGRIIIDAEKHVDVPFYAIPRDDFVSWKPSGKTEFAAYRESYSRVDPNKVMLAHRQKNWVNSDPRKVLEWVWEMKGRHGKLFLDVCRCLKAWRDHQWEKDSPLSSILIMTVVGRAFDSGVIDAKNCQIDMAVWKAAIEAAMLIQQGRVLNPDGDGDDLTADIDDASKKNIIARLENLAKVLQSVLCDDQLNQTVAEKLCREFGKHYPEDSNLIRKCAVVAAVAAGAAAPIVRAAPPYAE